MTDHLVVPRLTQPFILLRFIKSNRNFWELSAKKKTASSKWPFRFFSLEALGAIKLFFCRPVDGSHESMFWLATITQTRAAWGMFYELWMLEIKAEDDVSYCQHCTGN